LRRPRIDQSCSDKEEKEEEEEEELYFVKS
jgi:hypothetical protein